MDGNFRVRAPYSFVPFSNKILVYDQELPAHDKLDPSLKTGEIHVTMTAETPVFVSNGDRDDPHFFRGPNGKYMIPGSTIRGMARENMQILGFGIVRPGEDMKDYQIYYRDMASARESTGGPLKEYYKSVLDIASRKTQSGKTYSVPQNVQAGYLRKVGDHYEIQPVKGKYLRVSRKATGVASLGDQPARTVDVGYRETNGQVKEVCSIERMAKDMRTGTLLFTGRPVGKPNHLYLFPEPDVEADPVPISKADEISYREDWETRKNSLKPADFWALPENGTEKPVFYVHHNGHIYFGMSLFLRVGYQHALSEGLPQNHKDKVANGALDYPRAILGFADSDSSYRSRVSFGDFAAAGTPKEMGRVDMILGQPKPSYYPGYVVDGKNYAEDDFQLRGYKQYWLKEANAPTPEKVNVASHLRPLPAGTTFHGVIRYKNLRQEELGLLLWALRLDDGCYQSVGMGKPYGYGRMKLNIDELREMDAGKLYRYEGLAVSAEKSSSDAVSTYINCYDAFAAEKLYLKKPKKKPSIHSLDEIQDFFFLHSTIRQTDEVSYMKLDEYKNNRDRLPIIAKVRETAKPVEQVDAPPADDPYAALRAKFKKL